MYYALPFIYIYIYIYILIIIFNSCPFVGSQDLRAPDQTLLRTIHPSIVETLPDTFPELKHEFSKLESQMFDKPKRPGLAPLTPVLPDAHDRIFSPGYIYNPVHTEIYGTYRGQALRQRL